MISLDCGLNCRNLQHLFSIKAKQKLSPVLRRTSLVRHQWKQLQGVVSLADKVAYRPFRHARGPALICTHSVHKLLIIAFKFEGVDSMVNDAAPV